MNRFLLSALTNDCPSLSFQTKEKHSPYVDKVVEDYFLAVGGCGHAAKSCDEVGRVAASLAANGEWVSKVPRAEMKARWRTT